MNKIKATLLVIFFTSIVGINAQVDVNNNAEPESSFSPEQLISDVLITGSCNTVSNVTSQVSGTPTEQPFKNYGFFKRQAGSSFPFEEGIVLTSGIASRIQANAVGGTLSTATTGNSDADLANTLGVPTGQISDAAVIEFDFVPKSTRISFRYLMASQEYQGAFPCSFADSFAFLLRQSTETNYTNIAVVPGTTTPVSVTNVHAEIPDGAGGVQCSAQNESFFAGSDISETGFAGRTVVLTAQADVIPNVTYHIKLVVADFSDQVFDTAVFLEKGSFNLGLNLGNDLTIAGDNSVCGDSTLLTANVTATSYKWYKDGVEIPGETSQTYLANLGNGTYTCEINDAGCTDSDDIVLEFSEPATAIPPISDLSNCESNTFDLTLRTNDILNGQDPANFEVLFFSDPSYFNQITTPTAFISPSDNETIYVRKRNRNANNCFTDGTFRVLNFDNPVGQTASDYEVCDDVANGGDTDGFYNDFILSTKDSEVLGGLDPTLFNVSYHTTLSGAQTDNSTDAIDKNNPYRNATINEQTIYVRIENVANTNCFTVSEPATAFMPFRLIIHPLPVIANNPAQINQCDTDSDLITNINLTQAEISISNNHTNETFQYYPTQADAIADTAQITDPVSHTATNGDSVWVRTISSEGCFRISRLDITISFAGDVAYNEEFTTCDDFLDADGNDTINNDDRDGIANFDISPAIDDIKLLFDPTIRNDLDVLFFETAADRDAVINQIPDPANYRNTNIPASTQQSIFVKIINRINNDCTGLGEFFIRVLPLPEFEITTPQIVCLNSPSFIEAEMPDGTYTYEWRRNGVIDTSSTSETLDITQGGTYEVTAINTTTNCTRTRRIIVNESIIATLTEDDVTIIDDSTNNSITIDNSNNNLGIGDYEFALQDESNNTIIRDFQDTPMFENLNGGVYTILVRDKNGCGVTELEVSVLEFPKYFTPNNDGVNDVWVVKGASTTFYPQSSIHIFDRYGNPITEIAIDGQGWDGLYNGKVLPSNDYWFNIELTDRNGNKINRKGHFSLLRK